MNSISRSILARSLMTGAASLALMLMAPAWVHAETVIVQGTDGAAGGVNPDGDGPSGGDGEPAAADAGSVHPITFPLNQATATGGNGGRAEMARASAALAAMAERQLRGRRQPLFPARRRQTPILPAEMAAEAAFRLAPALMATVERAATRSQRAPRRTQTAVRSPATRARKVALEVSQALATRRLEAARSMAAWRSGNCEGGFGHHLRFSGSGRHFRRRQRRVDYGNRR